MMARAGSSVWQTKTERKENSLRAVEVFYAISINFFLSPEQPPKQGWELFSGVLQ